MAATGAYLLQAQPVLPHTSWAGEDGLMLQVGVEARADDLVLRCQVVAGDLTLGVWAWFAVNLAAVSRPSKATWQWRSPGSFHNVCEPRAKYAVNLSVNRY